MISNFESSVYSEETFPVSEAEHDEVMQMMAAESEGFAGYGEWSAQLDDSAESENFTAREGKLYHKPEPPSQGRIGGFEL
jgi:hypothetical protein